MSLPGDPNQWTFQLIRQLVDQGYLETDYYDFKAELNGKDPEHNQRLTKTACAFANTRGGFIVFGIRDLGEETKPRIEGITQSGDLANDFGQKIRAASPTVQFSFGNPPLKVPDSPKVIFVVYIPQSPNRPHMFEGQF